MIDSEGYRLNVGIILCNAEGRLFWARRVGQHSWQFPQGGIRRDESPEQAMFRELAEEVGLRPEHVQVIGFTKGWLHYRLPRRLVRRGGKTTCIGQKQIWFLLKMLSSEEAVRLDLSERPEFDHWQWVDYWYPLRAVVSFKRHVYGRALRELAPLLSMATPPRLSAARYVETALRGPVEKYDALPLREPPPIRSRQPEPASQPVTVLQIRRLEKSQNPVITRMVISARRLSTLEATKTPPVLEPRNSVASLEEGLDARLARSATSGSHRLYPR